MSTEPPPDPDSDARARRAARRAAADERRLSEGRHRFSRTSLAVISSLAVLAAALGITSIAQGPRLRSAEVNPAATILRDGQSLRLHASTPLATLSDAAVRVLPETPFTVELDDRTVTIRFASILDYGTEYTVEVAVTSLHTGAAGTLDYRFTTPDASLLTLVRSASQPGGGDGADRILRHGVVGGGSEVVFEAPKIQEYAPLAGMLAVVTLNTGGEPTLGVVRDDDPTPMQIALPPATTIRSLKSSPEAGLIGYLVESTGSAGWEHASTLFFYDVNSTTAVAQPVLDAVGERMIVTDWLFVPGTGYAVLQDADLQLHLFDVLGDGSSVPLGHHVELHGVIPGTSTLVVGDPTGGTLIDLASGATTPIDVPDADVDPRLYPVRAMMLDEDRYLQQFDDIDFASAAPRFTSVLVQVGSQGTTELFRPGSDSSRIRDFCLSPNGQYVAVEVVSGGTAGGGYAMLPGFGETATYLVSLRDGTTTRSMNGFLPSWCR